MSDTRIFPYETIFIVQSEEKQKVCAVYTFCSICWFGGNKDNNRHHMKSVRKADERAAKR